MYKLLIIASAAFLLSSCKKNVNEFASPFQQQAGRASSTSINESLDKAALIVAASLKDQAVRSFIKAEASKQFDGDYDILYQRVKKTSIKGHSWESILSGNLQERLSQSSGFENIVANVPNFQISVPVHCEQWDENSYTPLVAIAQLGVNEKDLKQIKAYDSEGNVHWIDAKTEPDMPLIAVGISERVDENGKLKYALEDENTAALRVNGQNTILGTIKYTGALTDIETVANGRPELRLYIYGAELLEKRNNPIASLIATKFYSPTKAAILTGYAVPAVNASLFPWYRDWSAPTEGYVYGSQLIFYWVEEDVAEEGGVPVASSMFNIGGTILSSNAAVINVALNNNTFNINSLDDDCGYAAVGYNDPVNTTYTTNNLPLKFKLN